MNVNNELERTYKLAVVPHFDMSLVSQYSHGETEENLSRSRKEKSISRFRYEAESCAFDLQAHYWCVCVCVYDPIFFNMRLGVCETGIFLV
jgi:hypothetical protein